MFSETCIAPINIAVVKYWGKRDENLILPINDSLSVTLSTEQLRSKTTIAASSNFEKDRLWLNGEEVALVGRVTKCIEKLKALSSTKQKFPLDWKLHICSENNFPTAAGLASSASGYACLVYTLACLYGVENEEISNTARLGSGSACRSMYGGFVHWMKGVKPDGSDSLAVQIKPSSHWPELHCLILVVDDKRKKYGSSVGMHNSVETSELLKYRAEKCVPDRIKIIKKAIIEKDFSTFAVATMKDSNQFHAICMDTYPPCTYLNDASQAIIDFVHKYNDARKEIKIAYTFDAGPNACLYALEDEVPNLYNAFTRMFLHHSSVDTEYVKGIPIDAMNALKAEEIFGATPMVAGKDLIKYIIHTKVGDGPTKFESEESLLDERGFPK